MAQPFRPEPGFKFLSSEMRFGGKVIKGAPYSAEAVTESVQTLSNGTKVTQRSSALIYRDGEGRTRREQAATAAGPFATAADLPRMVFINDPVAGHSYLLSPDSHTARKVPLLPPEQKFAPPMPPDHPDLGESKSEPLDRQLIEGLPAEGTRTIITIPVNQIGNDKPIEVVSERWYSPDLQTTVLSRHSDPRWGTTTYKLTNIKQGEPDHSLFTLPAEYTVKEGKGGAPWEPERRGGPPGNPPHPRPGRPMP